MVYHCGPSRGCGTGEKEHLSRGNRGTKDHFEGKGNIGEQGK